VPRSVRGSDGRTTLVELVGSPPTLLIVSASSVAYPLSSLAKTLGYRVVITDPRSDYVTRDLFPDADELLCIWPRELPKHVTFGPRVYVVSLNHEARFEDDLIAMLAAKASARAAARPVVGYLGAIGKAKRHTERVERLTAAGVDLSVLPPIHTPIGLDLGGKGAEEVALSVMAEIQAHRYGRTGGRLRDTRAARLATADLDTPSAVRP
jgi:xanthine dehydrogenase accessory factor